jgi:hypothetical protein
MIDEKKTVYFYGCVSCMKECSMKVFMYVVALTAVVTVIG